MTIDPNLRRAALGSTRHRAVGIRHCFPLPRRFDADMVAGEIDVLPAERRQVGEEFVAHLLDSAHEPGQANPPNGDTDLVSNSDQLDIGPA